MSILLLVASSPLKAVFLLFGGQLTFSLDGKAAIRQDVQPSVQSCERCVYDAHLPCNQPGRGSCLLLNSSSNFAYQGSGGFDWFSTGVMVQEVITVPPSYHKTKGFSNNPSSLVLRMASIFQCDDLCPRLCFILFFEKIFRRFLSKFFASPKFSKKNLKHASLIALRIGFLTIYLKTKSDS